MIDFSNYMVEGFLLVALVIFSWIDIKKREFPSVLTTAVLFIMLMLRFDNIEFGVLAFVFGWFLMDIDFFEGTADLKIITMIGLMVSSLGMFFLFMFITLIFGTVYKILMVKVVKQKDETAFVPVFLVVYITMLILELF
jgi:hypothetical protein